MNVFAKFDEIPSMILQDIKETKRVTDTSTHTHARSEGQTDNVKTVYPTTNTVYGVYIYSNFFASYFREKHLFCT